MAKKSSIITAGALALALAFGAGKARAEEQFKQEPKIIASFEYNSHRPEPEYFGKKFMYNIWSDNTISQADKPRVKFSQIWFYDVDGDGKFGKAELDMLKSGKLIYMHPEFNKIANSEIRSALEAMLLEAKKGGGTEKVLKDVLSELPDRALALEEQELSKKEKKPLPTPLSTIEMGDVKKEQIKKEPPEYEKIKLPLPEIEEPDVSLEPPKYEKIKLPLPEPPKETEKKSYFSIITQGTSNEKFDSYTGSLGLRFNFNEEIGLSALLDLGFGLDKLTDSYSAPLSAGRTASGTITDTNKLSIGGSLETQLGPFVIGGGIDYKIWIKNVVEQILDCSGRVVKSNTNSIPNRQVFGKGYLGVEFQPTDGWKLGAILGCNWKDGFYFGIRNNFRLNSKKK